MAAKRSTIRVVIVDDEPIARRGIRQHLATYPQVEIIGECRHGQEAVATILAMQPDLVFLDIQMPEMNGFDVVRAIGIEAMPMVIFVTAYDQYALEAFAVYAFDYLLKPIDPERFHQTFARSLQHLQANDWTVVQERLDALMQATRQPQPVAPSPVERLVIKEGGRIFFVEVANIQWIESAGNYVHIHTDDQKHLLRETMSGMEAKLDARRFVRISRAALINTRFVKAFMPYAKGRFLVQFEDGTQLTTSRHYRANLDALFENT